MQGDNIDDNSVTGLGGGYRASKGNGAVMWRDESIIKKDVAAAD